MSNPYQAPSYDPKPFQDPVAPTGWGWVNQVRIVAVLNAVQGGLEVAVGLLLTAAGGIISALGASIGAGRGPFANRPEPEMPPWVVGVIYLAIGVPILLIGALRIFAGVQNFRYRGRTLGIISMIVGMASVFTCYCAPTGIGVLIYGMIVYLNPAVIAAFAMGQQGASGQEILAAFMPYRPMPNSPMPNSPMPNPPMPGPGMPNPPLWQPPGDQGPPTRE
jgi:hypothetical protein